MWTSTTRLHARGSRRGRSRAVRLQAGVAPDARRLQSFAVAFSYISPSTGIFALFFLGLTTIGGVFF